MSPERIQQIQELYHAAKEREPGQRDAFLVEACGSDEGLFRELSTLLAQDSSGGPMDTPLCGIAANLLGDLEQPRLLPGALLGPYEIVDRLDEGGMGEVYRARDTRLGRTVAIKVASEEFSGRFLSEARAISALNHSHICTLYDVGADYLVMELVEGQTLAAVLRSGPIPLPSVLRYSAEIADALSAAHSKSIVHRDLKPSNIMVTRAGIKILDFGLAKFSSVQGMGDAKADAMTVGDAVAGTPAYMAPEQVEGKECDARTDVFALGVVLFEMATGCKVFTGDSRASLVAEIMRCEPVLEKLAPSHLRRIVARCLEKDPDNRWQSARDVALELRDLVPDGGPLLSQAPSSRLRRNGWLMSATLLVLLLALGIAYFSNQPAAIAEVEFSVPPPTSAMGFALDFAVAVSPDGRQVGLRAVGPDGHEELWVRSINSSVARPIPGTSGAMGFFWSPDSQRIAFFSDKLRSIDIHGGTAVVLSDVRVWGLSSGTWGPDGDIVLNSRGPDGCLSRFSTQNSVGERLHRINTSLSGHCYEPQFLPDGRHVLFGYRSVDHRDIGIFLVSLDGGTPTRLVSGGSHGYYTRPPGSSQAYIVFERNMILMAQAYDDQRHQMTGEAWAISSKPLTAWRAFSTSQNGVIAFRAGNPARSLGWFNRKGQQIATLPFEGDYRQIALSPDESMLAGARMDETSTDISNIWLMDLSRGTSSRLTSYGANDWYPVWSPDGRQIAFASSKDGPYNIYVRPVAPIGDEHSMVATKEASFGLSWSHDGKFMACSINDPKTHGDLWIVPVLGSEPFPFLRTEFDEFQPEFSPDGHWIAYSSNESGRSEIYIRRFDGTTATGAATRISIGGGSLAKWRRDGRELFFLAPDRKLMSAEIHLAANVRPSAPLPLFQTRIYMANFLAGYAVAQNGQRFLINAPTKDADSSPVTVIANWNPGVRH